MLPVDPLSFLAPRRNVLFALGIVSSKRHSPIGEIASGNQSKRLPSVLNNQFGPTTKTIIKNNGDIGLGGSIIGTGGSLSGASMVITSGNVGIGTTTPSAKLHVVGDIFATGGTSSTRELKENIVFLSDDEAKDTLEQLKPVKFNYKNDPKSDLQLGFIAEDVPEMVSTPERKAIMLGLTPNPTMVIIPNMKKTKVLCTKPSMSLHQLKAQFSTEEACKAYLKALRWPKGVHCPRCNKSEKIYELKARPFHWICKNADCGGKNGYRFSIITKTVFENTNYPLKTWFEVIYLMTQSKKGISALQIHRQIGSGDYRTAWYMCHRIRAAMQDGDVTKMLGGSGGVVEVDETYMGGKEGNKHWKNRQGGRGTAGKIPVIGAIARKGNVVCKMIQNTDTATLDGFVRKTVADDVSLIATDEHSGYRFLKNHEAVRHGQGEYVRGQVHTANIDSFWSLLKRGVMGTYHHMSKKYLPLYLSEFSFRHNNRQNPAIFREVVAGC